MQVVLSDSDVDENDESDSLEAQMQEAEAYKAPDFGPYAGAKNTYAVEQSNEKLEIVSADSLRGMLCIKLNSATFSAPVIVLLKVQNKRFNIVRLLYIFTRTLHTTCSAVAGIKVTSSGPLLMVTRPLPRVLLLHTGGTLGMDPMASFETEEAAGELHLKQGTGGVYPAPNKLQPGRMLADLLATVPELRTFANLDVHVLFNKDSCRIGPAEWLKIAKTLHAAREVPSAQLPSPALPVTSPSPLAYSDLCLWLYFLDHYHRAQRLIFW